MRMDFKIMRDLAAFTRRSAQQRMEEYNRILGLILGNDDVQKLMKQWGFRLDKAGFAKTIGCAQQSEKIYMRNRDKEDATDAGAKADWDNALKKNQLYNEPAALKKMAFIGMKKAEKDGIDFCKEIISKAKSQGWSIVKPDMTFLSSERDIVKTVQDKTKAG